MFGPPNPPVAAESILPSEFRPLGTPRDYFLVVAVIAAVGSAGYFLPLSYLALGYIFLLAVIGLSTQVERVPALAAAVLAGCVWNYVFVPPRMMFSRPSFDEGLLMTIYFAVALIGSQLTSLRAAADRAKLLVQSERMHQTLFDSVAHELKTPISVVRTAVGQLEADDPARRRLVAVEIRIAVQRLENLVGNLLSQTRLESGILRPRLDWCECRDLAASARRAVAEQLEDRPLTVDVPSELPLVRVDAVLTEQAICLLLVNAAVHTPPGTRVRLHAEKGPGTDRVFLSVSDEGPGIPAELRPRLFSKFSRGPSPRRGGLGLGLSIVKGLMAAQGGSVLLSDSATGGACFTLDLPSGRGAFGMDS